MKLQTFMLITVCLLVFSAGLNGESVCSRYNITGTYVTTLSGWATIGVANGVPLFAPVKGVGTVTIDASGNFTGAMTSVVAGTPNSLATTGSIDVTSDCKVSAKASCAAGCEWTAVGVFVNNTKEANLVLTSQTDGGKPAPITASLDMKRIGN